MSNMTDIETAATFNLLGALFALDPVDPQFAPILEGFNRQDLLNGWPSAEPQELATIAALMYPSRQGELEIDALSRAYNDLFVGPDPLQAPPWGSIYLDEEHALYGPSTLRLQAFLRHEAVTLEATIPGPEDHFGSLCWLAAWLIAEGRRDAFNQLLDEHLLPWADLYLDMLEKAARDMAVENNVSALFYAGAVHLARLTLRAARQDIDGLE